MTNPKPLSSYLPILLIIVGLVVCLAVVVGAFVPLVECRRCGGLGVVVLKYDSQLPIPSRELKLLGNVRVSNDFHEVFCGNCNHDRMTTLLKYWTYDPSTYVTLEWENSPLGEFE